MLKTFLATITLAAPAITVAPLPSHAQSDYPNRMVRIVVVASALAGQLGAVAGAAERLIDNRR
jgi:predicted cobalt transporter CbtA